MSRAVLKGGERVVHDANRNEHSRGRSLLRGQDMGKTQTTETVLNNGWRLAAVGGWRLVAVGSWRLVAVGGGWRRLVVLGGCPSGLCFTKKRIGVLKDSPGRGTGPSKHQMLKIKSAGRAQSEKWSSTPVC